jgi:very-short-patch-repair endonuclease
MDSLAKKLRQQSTDAERMLWKYLRAHRMSGYKFRRQVVIEPYIVDFLCLEARLIVEADGGQHLEQAEKDLQRSLFLEALGYKVIRFWNHEILGNTETVLEQIHSHLIEAPLPLPNPLPEGEGIYSLASAMTHTPACPPSP